MEEESAKFKKLWHERSERPIAARPMTKDQIREFQQYLVMSYKCDPADISYEFEKIFDENDEDRDDCLWLKYKMHTIWQGKPTTRVIYTIKLPIPEDLKMMAEQMKRQNSGMRRTRRMPQPNLAIMPAQNNSEITIEEIESEETRPKLKKPTRRVNKIV